MLLHNTVRTAPDVLAIYGSVTVRYLYSLPRSALTMAAGNLTRSRGGSSTQIRKAPECGPMHPLGCGLNQGQGSPRSEVSRILYHLAELKLMQPHCENCDPKLNQKMVGWKQFEKIVHDVIF